jgi:hypothetical protein
LEKFSYQYYSETDFLVHPRTTTMLTSVAAKPAQ